MIDFSLNCHKEDSQSTKSKRALEIIRQLLLRRTKFYNNKLKWS